MLCCIVSIIPCKKDSGVVTVIVAKKKSSRKNLEQLNTRKRNIKKGCQYVNIYSEAQYLLQRSIDERKEKKGKQEKECERE